MSNMEIEPNGADQVALSQADAAIAASGSDTSEEDDPFQTEEEIQAELDRLQAKRAAAQTKALRGALANSGFAYRNILRSEKVKQHFTSPFSKENAMSPEDILSEIPKEDLHEVGMVQRRIFMPASFVQKWIIPPFERVTPSTVKALNCQEDTKRQCCFRFSTNRSWTQPRHVNKLTMMITPFARL